MDRVVPLCLSPDPSSQEDSGKDQGEADRGHRPQLAKEILVPSTTPDGMRDPSRAPSQNGSLVTTPAGQGRALPHQPLDSPVDGLEAEWRALQNKVFSDAANRTILAATHDTTREVYNGRWESFISWCGERGQNPICTSPKQILDFLQLKSEVLAMNTIKGYVTAISCRHALV